MWTGIIGPLYALLAITCVVPISYQVFTLLRPRSPGYVRFLAALAVLLACVFAVFKLIPWWEKEVEWLTVHIVVPALFVLGTLSTLRTAFQLRLVRKRTAVVLLGYSVLLVIGFLLSLRIAAYE